MLRLFLVCSLIVAISAQDLPEDGPPPMYKHRVEDVIHIRPRADSEYLLPKTSHPINYNIELWSKIDEEILAFEGDVEIEIKMDASSSTVVLHVLGEVIDELKVFKEDRLTEVAATFEHDNNLQFLVITTVDEVLEEDDTYFLRIKYHSELAKTGDGFYVDYYVNEAGDTVYLATTQFEATYARHAFPCYDEPALKATFQIKINHGCGFKAYSNMPESFDRDEDNKCSTSFEKTPVMSSYLIAFVVSDFEFRENYDGPITKDRLKHRIIARSRYIENDVALPLQWSEEFVNELAAYTQTTYDLPKIDQIGIPSFGGAMENWGLVVYGENSLFYPANNVFNKIVSVHSIIAHEYAHQWFGDLVGPEEWGYLWLNEGFATLFASYIPERLYSQYHSLDTLINNACTSIKTAEATSRTRPMSSPVYDPRSIGNSFDNIAYSKSGCVLNMLMHAVTPEVFADGLRAYLSARSYAAANPDHLSEALNSVVHQLTGFPADLEFKDILDSWHLQSGFPLLHVDYNRETGAITLNQKRYVTEAITDPAIWHIPYNFFGSSEAGNTVVTSTVADGWFKSANQVISPSTARDWTGSDFVLFNKGNTGYYRVNYDDDNWEALIAALKTENHGRIPHLSRGQLIMDSWEFATQNIIDYFIPVSMLRYLSTETNYFPWRNAFIMLTNLENRFMGSESYPFFMAYVNEFTSKGYPVWGIAEVNNEDPLSNYARTTMISWACKSGVEECLTDATAAVKANLNTGGVISEYLKSAVNVQGLRKLDSDNFLKYWKRQQAETVQADRTIYLNALSATEDATLRNLFLTTAVTPNGQLFDGVAIQYTAVQRSNIFVNTLTNNPETVDEIMTFVTANLQAINQLLPNNRATVLSNIASKIKTQPRLNAFIELVTHFPDIDTTGYLSSIEDNINWFEEEGLVIDEWFTGEFGGAGSLVISWMLLLTTALFVRFQL